MAAASRHEGGVRVWRKTLRNLTDRMGHPSLKPSESHIRKSRGEVGALGFFIFLFSSYRRKEYTPRKCEGPTSAEAQWRQSVIS
jgi:hypothetical protein